MPFLSGYTSRWEYTIDATKVPSTQTNFPVYVDLSNMPASFWSVVANGGGDIRVTRSDGETEVAREVVSCDTATDTGELHFLANTVDGTTNTKYYIYANGTSADYATTDTYGRNAVWGDYAAVYHLENNFNDSTANGNDLTSYNSPTFASQKIGGGVSLNGSNQYADILPADQTGLQITGDVTLQAWINPDDINGRAVITQSANGETEATNQLYQWFLYSDGDALLWWEYGAGLNEFDNRSTPLVTTNAWQQFHLVRDTTAKSVAFYDQGSLGNTTSYSDNPSGGSSSQFTLGANHNGANQHFYGDIDEVRVRAGTLSANWITTEYNNQSDHSTWATIGAEENPGGGVVNNALYSFGGL